MVKTVLALDDSCLLHQELQLVESAERLMSAPTRLNFNGRENRSVGAFEHRLGTAHHINNLLVIRNTAKQVLFRITILLKIG